VSRREGKRRGYVAPTKAEASESVAAASLPRRHMQLGSRAPKRSSPRRRPGPNLECDECSGSGSRLRRSHDGRSIGTRAASSSRSSPRRRPGPSCRLILGTTEEQRRMPGPGFRRDDETVGCRVARESVAATSLQRKRMHRKASRLRRSHEGTGFPRRQEHLGPAACTKNRSISPQPPLRASHSSRTSPANHCSRPACA
jgi:hypothetical protein